MGEKLYICWKVRLNSLAGSLLIVSLYDIYDIIENGKLGYINFKYMNIQRKLKELILYQR